MAYTLVYLLVGCLPWQGKTYSTKEEKAKITRDLKFNTSTELICAGAPPEFNLFLTYCRGLKFDERPDYPFIKKIFKDLFTRSLFEFDYIFDWTILNYVRPMNLKRFYTARRSLNEEEERKEECLETPGLVEVGKAEKKCDVF